MSFWAGVLQDIISNIKQSQRDMLEATELMGEETAKEALKKVDYLTITPGHPTELLNASLVREHYAGLTTVQDSENVKQHTQPLLTELIIEQFSTF